MALLRCPVCGADGLTGSLRRGRIGGLTCPSGHHWDAARQGYVNLLTGAGTPFTPDTAAMIDARNRFLAAGYYDRIADAVADAATGADAGHGESVGVRAESSDPVARAPLRPLAVLDAGAGTGHYLAAVVRALSQEIAEPIAVATDLSPAALKVLARAVPTALPLVWDTWRPLPLRDGVVDVVLAVFAPRNMPEFARVLVPGGRLVLVTPRPGHLAGLRELTGMLAIDPEKDDRLDRTLAEHVDLVSRRDVDVRLRLDVAGAVDAAFMGPAGHHAGREELEARVRDRLTGDEVIDVDAQVTVHVLTPRPPSRSPSVAGGTSRGDGQ